MTRRRLPKRKSSILILVAALVIGYLSGMQPRELLKLLEGGFKIDQASEPTARPSSRPKSDQPPSRAESKSQSNGYTRLDGCTLASWGGNDGDSFKVRHNGENHIMRLYFVDTPETNFRYPDRITHQARYFKTSREKTVAIGKKAKKFTADLLQDQSFTVYTRWESVMGGRRFHAFVVTPEGDFLCEALVERGLARIYTMPADLPDGTAKNTFKHQLKKLEATAKRQKLGGWR